MHGWRLMLVVSAGVLAAVAGTVLAVALNVATGGSARWFPTMERYPLWWTGGGTAGVAGAGFLVWWAQRWYERRSAELVPAVRPPESWVVDRPDEVNQIVAALSRGGTVGITTAVQGAGGFGKTTIAKMARADPRVLREFRGRVYWVTVGRDTAGDALALLVNGLIARIDPDHALIATDAVQAAEQLAAVLAQGPKRLLILDDVWTDEQLAAFPLAGRSARLVTTRNSSLDEGAVMVPVLVDQMSDAQARALLLAGLSPLPPAVVAGLLAETGRWPLLLRLANKILTSQARLQPDAAKAAEELLGLLHAGGALQVDELTGTAGQQLDVADPVQRASAIQATIQASTSLLRPADRDRLAELAVFARNEAIPVPLIWALWQVTGGFDPVAARALCARLADLALLTLAPGDDGGAITMHDVIRDYLAGSLGEDRLAQLHAILLDAVADGLPHAPAADGVGEATAWWDLPEQARYLRDHLIEHLVATRQPGDAETAATDLRWAAARLEQSGPAAPYADLTLIGTPRAERLRRVLGQNAHLLSPTAPPHSLTDILYSRVSHDPDWGPQAQALADTRKLPALSSKWPPPDLPSPGLRRTLTGHAESVDAVAIAPDGTWLATGSDDKTVRIWDAATGRRRATLTGHTDVMRAVAIAPEGTWLATGGYDKTVRIWDAATGHCRTIVTGHKGTVDAVAIAPDGTWLATASSDDTVRIWDAATGRRRATLTGHTNGVNAVAIAPDGTWLATGSADKTVRIWDALTGHCRATLTGHTNGVNAVAIAPDGTWLATGGYDKTVRIWDVLTGHCRATLTGHTIGVNAVAIAPEGTWLATGGYDETVRIWDAATGHCRATLTGHMGTVHAVAIAPDGTWLATSGYDGAVRIWDAAHLGTVAVKQADRMLTVYFAPDGTWLASTSGDRGDKTVRVWDAATGHCRATLTGVVHAVDAPDGTWIATSGDDGTARIWDAATGHCRATLTGHTGVVCAIAIAPDSAWLATSSGDKTARIWDAATGHCRVTLTGHTGLVCAIAIAPDGTWLATGSDDGTARIWDAASGSCRVTLAGHTNSVYSVANAPDGTWLATGSDDGTARIWDAATGSCRVTLVGMVWAVAPDGTWLATTSYDRLATTSDDNRVRVWDAATGHCRATLTGHMGALRAVAIAPDGTWLATTSYDKTVRIWDAATGHCRATLTSRTKSAEAVAIAPDGTWLATTSGDNRVRVWDAATGGISAVMRVDSPLSDCAWSTSGRLLAAAGDAGIHLFAFNAYGSGTPSRRSRDC